MNADPEAADAIPAAGRSLVVVTLASGQPAGLDPGVYDRVVVIGPDAALANGPEGKILRLNNVVTDDDTEVSVERYNLPGLAAVQPPTDTLHALFPGLQRRDRVAVPPLTPGAFVALFDDLPQPIDIWVDAPGQERSLLTHLIDVVDRVSHLSVRCAVMPLFRDQPSESEVSGWMRDAGLKLWQADRRDPDRPLLRWHVTPRTRKPEALRKEGETDRADTDTRIAELEAERDTAREALRAARAEHEQSRTDTDARIAALTAERAALREAVQTAHTERDRDRADAGDRIAKLETERDALREAVHGVQAERDRDRVDADARFAKLETERDALRDTLASVRQDRKTGEEALRRENERARADLAVALRAQAAAKADLDDLRARYGDLERTSLQQGDLLRALTARLQQASHQLRDVALSGPDDDDAPR